MPSARELWLRVKTASPFIGAVVGGGAGALLSPKKNRLRNALLGAAGGAGVGYLLQPSPAAAAVTPYPLHGDFGHTPATTNAGQAISAALDPAKPMLPYNRDGGRAQAFEERARLFPEANVTAAARALNGRETTTGATAGTFDKLPITQPLHEQASTGLFNDMFAHHRVPRPGVHPGRFYGLTRHPGENGAWSMELRPGLSGPVAQSTLLHEATHALGGNEMAARVADNLFDREAGRRATQSVLNTQLPAQIGAALAGGGWPNMAASLAGNQAASEYHMPDRWSGMWGQPASPLYGGLRASYQAAQRNNYFNPQTPNQALNVFPSLEAALPHFGRVTPPRPQ